MKSYIKQAKAFAPSAAVFLVILVLSATFGKFLVSQILALRKDLSELSKVNKALEEKKEILSSINQDDFKKKAQVAMFAVPDEPSGLANIASVKSYARQLGLNIDSLFVREGASGGKGEVSISAKVSGQNISSALSFIKSIENGLPLSQITKSSLSANQDVGMTITSVDFISFWSPLPDQLPSVETPAENLTAYELSLITELEKRGLPAQTFISPLSPAGRNNPFTLESVQTQ